MPQLDALLEDEVEIFYYDKGKYQVQLEVPRESSLIQTDTERILSIVSWEGGRIDDKIDSYEGGRSVVITKSKPSYSRGIKLNALQISGVGYREPKRTEKKRIFVEGETMVPPSTDNFYDLLKEDELRTSGIKNGTMTIEKGTYTPLGSYIEERLRNKITKTRLTSTLPCTLFSVPSVEAYGRYVNLIHDDQHLGFVVFSIPDVNLYRFAAQFVRDSYDNKWTFKNFTSNMRDVITTLGRCLWELHSTGYTHRQPHFSNFYYLKEKRKIHLMDWSTTVPLDGNEENDILKRALDLRIVHQNYELLSAGLFEGNVPEFYLNSSSNDMLEKLLRAYFGRGDIQVMESYNALCAKKLKETGDDFVEDFEAITEIVKEELRGRK